MDSNAALQKGIEALNGNVRAAKSAEDWEVLWTFPFNPLVVHILHKIDNLQKKHIAKGCARKLIQNFVKIDKKKLFIFCREFYWKNMVLLSLLTTKRLLSLRILYVRVGLQVRGLSYREPWRFQEWEQVEVEPVQLRKGIGCGAIARPNHPGHRLACMEKAPVKVHPYKKQA